MKALKYIGRHKTFTDKIYGTGLRWERDVTVHRIEAKLANRFLRHKDSFAEVEGAAMLARTGDAPAAMVPRPAQSDLEIELLRDSIQRMDMESLSRLAFTQFAGLRLDTSIPVEEARRQVTMMVDRFLPINEPPPQGGENPGGVAVAAMVPQPAQSDDTQDGPGDVAPTIHEDNIVAEVLGLSAKGMKHGEIGKHLGLHHMQVSKIIRDHFSD
jgi:hypothetical protein